jgi:hypothetical protein
MAPVVEFFTDPTEALAAAASFLERRPVDHNVILTLLRQRVAAPMAGRYWVVSGNGEVEGVAFQSPPDFSATVTPMARETVASLVPSIAEAGVVLPGVIGEASTAASFAGRWTEVTRSAAVPLQGQRIYRLGHLTTPPAPPGHLRPGVMEDLDLIIRWSAAFAEDAGVRPLTRDDLVGRVAAGQFRIWVDDGPVSMAARSAPVAGVTRINEVYSPPEARQRGYASACVGQPDLQLDLPATGL